MNMEIKYPVLNISVLEWNYEIANELIFENDIYHSNDKIFFDTYIQGHKYVDCNGDVYKVIGRVPVKNLWKCFFLMHKYKVLFEKSDVKISMEELRNLMVERVNRLDWKNDIKHEWIGRLKQAKTIKQLLNYK